MDDVRHYFDDTSLDDGSLSSAIDKNGDLKGKLTSYKEKLIGNWKNTPSAQNPISFSL